MTAEKTLKFGGIEVFTTNIQSRIQAERIVQILESSFPKLKINFDLCETEFKLFLEKEGQALKSEFYIPYVAGRFHELGLGKVKVIPTNAKWFGVTYKEDAPGVKQSINALVDNKVYPSNLW